MSSPHQRESFEENSALNQDQQHKQECRDEQIKEEDAYKFKALRLDDQVNAIEE